MRINIIFTILIALISCTTAKLPVSQEFSRRSYKMPVKGLNGLKINQKLSFGNYQTSGIKRGWDLTKSVQYAKFFLRSEEAFLKEFDINTENKNLRQKNKFQYTIEGDDAIAEVYATETFIEKRLAYKSNNLFIGDAGKTIKYEYSFTAAIVPVTEKNMAPWTLVLISAYDITKNTGRGLFDKPYVEEEGYATNGQGSFAIRPMRVDKVTLANGKETKVHGDKLLGGYEISTGNKAICVIDILDNSVSIANDAEPSQKIIISSIASAILLKRMQDMDKDKDEL